MRLHNSGRLPLKLTFVVRIILVAGGVGAKPLLRGEGQTRHFSRALKLGAETAWDRHVLHRSLGACRAQVFRTGGQGLLESSEWDMRAFQVFLVDFVPDEGIFVVTRLFGLRIHLLHGGNHIKVLPL